MRQKFRFFDASIQLRVIYALISSLLWWAMVETDRLLVGWADGYLNYATGAVYVALVLLPYLPSLKGTFKFRALGLLLCGVLSYWVAVHTTSMDLGLDALDDRGSLLRDIDEFGIAGAVGAVIVGIGARLFIPLALKWKGWLMLMGAGCLGGIVLGVGYNVGFSRHWGINYEYWLAGHIAWQVLVCLALYYGSNRGGQPNRSQQYSSSGTARTERMGSGSANGT